MKTRYMAVASIAAFLIGACATAPSPGAGGAAAEAPDGPPPVIELLNQAEPTELAERSSVPFFFDAELIVRSADVELVWSGLREVGFEVPRQGHSFDSATPDDYRLVADTFDMAAFFAPGGPVTADAEWLVTDSSIGPVRILLTVGPQPMILGIARISE